MTESSFQRRDPVGDDPVVCDACGATLGPRALLADEAAARARSDAHKPECVRRLRHQRRHRTLAGPCPECRP